MATPDADVATEAACVDALRRADAVVHRQGVDAHVACNANATSVDALVACEHFFYAIYIDGTALDHGRRHSRVVPRAHDDAKWLHERHQYDEHDDGTERRHGARSTPRDDTAVFGS